MTTPPQVNHLVFPASESPFKGGGTMGEQMRSFDWASHPLGSPQHWPASLVTGIRMLLHSGFPMFIWWSRELYMFHNDAYLPCLGEKSNLPGGKAGQVWSDVMEQLGEVVEAVFNGHEQFYFEELLVPMQRKGFVEDTYWTFSYSPMPDDTGGVGGLLCSCVEVTASVLQQRRFRLIAQLSGVTASRTTLAAASGHICSLLRDYPADLPFSALYLLDPDGDGVTLAAQTGRLSTAQLPERLAFNRDTDGLSGVLSQVSRTRQGVRVCLTNLDGTLPPSSPDAGSAGIFLPLVEAQGQQLVGFLLAGISPRLPYEQAYEHFHQMLSGQIGTVLSAVRDRQRAEQQRARLHFLFMLLPAATAVLRGPKHVFELVNPLSQQLIGGRDVLGKTVREALPELDNQPFFELLDGVYQTGEPFLGSELPAQLDRQGDGNPELGYFNVAYLPIHSGEGRVEGVLSFSIEVTELVRARQGIEQAELHLRQALQAGKMGTWHLDLLTKLATRSLLHDQLFGYEQPVKTWPADQWLTHILPDYQEGVRALFRESLSSGELHLEVPVRGSDGQVRWLGAQGEVFYEQGKPVGIAGIVTDVTQRRAAQQHLQELTEELATSNEELAAANEEIMASNEELLANNEELSAVNGQLAKANADLDTFVYAASHDLKSPVTSLSALLKYLHKRLDGQLDAKSADLLQMIEASADRLQRTIRDLTQVAKVQRTTEEEKKRVSFPDLWQDIRADLQAQITETRANIRVSFGEEHFLYSPQNARSILYNLVSNALKYHSPLRQPLIEIRTCREGDKLVLTVADNGLGLSASQQASLFTMFKRFHTHVDGSGVGLYMIKRMIENNGGTIQVSSELDKGTLFRIVF